MQLRFTAIIARSRLGKLKLRPAFAAKATAAVLVTVYAVNQPGGITFDSPTERVTDATSVLVAGSVTNDATKQIAIRANDRSFEVAVKGRRFSQVVPLKLGENTIQSMQSVGGVHVVNQSGKFTVTAVGNGPIVFDMPEENRFVSTDEVTIRGRVAMASGVEERALKKIRVVDKDDVSWVAEVDPITGRFETKVPLNPGRNEFECRAYDDSAYLELGDKANVVIYRLAPVQIVFDEIPQLVRTREIEISGLVQTEGPLPPSVRVGVNNGEQVDTPVTSSGRFNTTVTLSPNFERPDKVVASVADYSESLLVNRLFGQFPCQLHPSRPGLDVVFVVDVSESMKDYLPDIRKYADELAEKLRGNPNTRVGILRFGHGARLDSTLKASSPADVIKTLSLESRSVGDGEDQLLAIVESVSSGMGWRPETVHPSARAIVIFTDEQAATDSFDRLSNEQNYTEEDLQFEAVAKRLDAARVSPFWLIPITYQQDLQKSKVSQEAIKTANQLLSELEELRPDGQTIDRSRHIQEYGFLKTDDEKSDLVTAISDAIQAAYTERMELVWDAPSEAIQGCRLLSGSRCTLRYTRQTSTDPVPHQLRLVSEEGVCVVLDLPGRLLTEEGATYPISFFRSDNAASLSDWRHALTAKKATTQELDSILSSLATMTVHAVLAPNAELEPAGSALTFDFDLAP